MKRRLSSALIIVGVSGLLAISMGLYSRFFGRKRLRFAYLTGQLAPGEYQALASKPGWSPSGVEVAPGTLLGLIRRPSRTDAPWVLFYPGNDADQLKSGQRFLSRLGDDQDWGLAVFAYRGYDSSPGDPVLSDLADDAFDVLTHLCQSERTVPEKVNLVGFSIGGYLAVRVTGATTRGGHPPATLSLLASVDDIEMVRRSLWMKVDPGDDYQTRPFLKDVRAPVLVLQGDADLALAGPDQGRAIAAALGDRAQYVELPGAGHNDMMETDPSIAQIRSFISGHLSAR
jgi:pimeloyl-ACP methyl ester carboxylesterase